MRIPPFLGTNEMFGDGFFLGWLALLAIGLLAIFWNLTQILTHTLKKSQVNQYKVTVVCLFVVSVEMCFFVIEAPH